ncbi:MAG: hypothetical protein AAF488_15215 [Planctomycetota bacterium]
MTEKEPPIEASTVKRDRKIYLGLLLVLMAFSIYLSLELREMTVKAQDLRDDLDLERILATLSVPSEAIYYDEETIARISELRRELYLARGTETMVPYAAIALRRGANDQLPNRVAIDPVSTEEGVAIFRASYETYWHNRSWSRCELLAHEIEHREGSGEWLLQHRELYNTHVRPLVERLLDAYDPFPRRSACKLLLAMGDRSERVKATLEQLAVDPALSSADHDQMKEWIAKHWPQ